MTGDKETGQIKHSSGEFGNDSLARAFGALGYELSSESKEVVDPVNVGHRVETRTENDGGEPAKDIPSGKHVESDETDYAEYEALEGGEEKIKRKNDGAKERPVDTIIVKGGANTNARPPEGPSLSEAEINAAKEVLASQSTEIAGDKSGGEAKPKKQTNGQKNFENRFGVLGDASQKLADAGENHEIL